MRERVADGSVRAASKGGDLTCGTCLTFDAGAGWRPARQFHVPVTLPACDPGASAFANRARKAAGLWRRLPRGKSPVSSDCQTTSQRNVSLEERDQGLSQG